MDVNPYANTTAEVIPPAPPKTVQIGGQARDYGDAVKMVQGGANWFYWVAALSLINVALQYSGSDSSMIVGLGVTLIIQGIAGALSEPGTVEQSAGPTIAVVAIALNVAIIGLFALFGWKARQLRAWAFYVGMSLYLLDSLIYVFGELWLAAGFHAFVLFSQWGALRALAAIRRAEREALIADDAQAMPAA